MGVTGMLEGALERSLWLGWEVRVQEGDECRIRVLRAPRSQMKGCDDLEQWREGGSDARSAAPLPAAFGVDGSGRGLSGGQVRDVRVMVQLTRWWSSRWYQ